MAAHVDWDNQEHAATAATGMDAPLFEIVGFRVPIAHYFVLQNEEHGDVFNIIRTYGVVALIQEALDWDNQQHAGPATVFDMGFSYTLRIDLTFGRGAHLMAAHVDWDNQEHGGTVAAGMDASLFEIVGFRVPISHYFFLQNEEHGDVFTIIHIYGVPSLLCRRHSTGTIRSTLVQERCPFPPFGLTWVSVTY